jgi:hypothetical protein
VTFFATYWPGITQATVVVTPHSELADGRPVLKSGPAASTAGLMREVFHFQGASSPFATAKQAAQELFLSWANCADRSADDFRNEAANAIPIWLDYTSLRQCADDFNLSFIQQLIWSFPVFIAAAESRSYTSRTFCVFELYNSYFAQERKRTGQKLWVVQNFAPNMDRMRTECEDIKTADATTRSPLHKDLIDEYIIRNVAGGFAVMDEMIRNVFMESVKEACGGEGGEESRSIFETTRPGAGEVRAGGGGEAGH